MGAYAPFFLIQILVCLMTGEGPVGGVFLKKCPLAKFIWAGGVLDFTPPLFTKLDIFKNLYINICIYVYSHMLHQKRHFNKLFKNLA
jgi:hypothetical protein